MNNEMVNEQQSEETTITFLFEPITNENNANAIDGHSTSDDESNSSDEESLPSSTSNFQLPISEDFVEESIDSTTEDHSTSSLSFTANRDDVLKRTQMSVEHAMINNAYENEIQYVKDTLEFNILLMGAPRIGKSQLTNALTGNKIHKAQTSSSLESCTQRLQRYEVTCGSSNDSSNEQSKVFIWDTKGIENWSDDNVVRELIHVIETIHPIAVIYCAAPGTFAKLHQVEIILNYCMYKSIFCAAVITNMWSGTREARLSVQNDLEKILERFGPRKILEFDTNDPILRKHEVIMYGDKALCTMVNSTPFVNLDLSSVEKPVRGIDELTYCIMQSLAEDKVRGWCQAVLGNRSFWQKIRHQTYGFVLEKYSQLPIIAEKLQHGLETMFSDVLNTLNTLFL
ncbi:unnamed protein product [Adineta ricciae]|uniref:G domain-containing protein n=1 Tax=Adineta ricciae TaxID=249248 RepID=A0A815C754_ADIRI|nr:unnamed protein product [Adineta ricciae]CAF1276603.1 unnamed protein product [Adineta ricciae]